MPCDRYVSVDKSAYQDPTADHKKAEAHKTEDKKADAHKAKDDAKEEASVVKDALKIAKSMSEHKDPVFKAPKKAVRACGAGGGVLGGKGGGRGGGGWRLGVRGGQGVCLHV